MHDSYCCWPALLDFLNIEIKQFLHIHTSGHTGSWTFSQTHEKRAPETLKGGLHIPPDCRGKASSSVSGILFSFFLFPCNFIHSCKVFICTQAQRMAPCLLPTELYLLLNIFTFIKLNCMYTLTIYSFIKLPNEVKYKFSAIMFQDFYPAIQILFFCFVTNNRGCVLLHSFILLCFDNLKT